MRRLPGLLLLLVSLAALRGDGPGDNVPDKVRPIPPKGVAVTEQDQADLRAGLRDLGDAIAALAKSLPPARRELLADVEVFHKAVDYALSLDEFHRREEVGIARKLLQ